MSATTRWTLFALALAVVFIVARPYVGAQIARLPGPGEALPGRSTPMALPRAHHVFGTPLDISPANTEVAVFGMGCFWGAEQPASAVPPASAAASARRWMTFPIVDDLLQKD